MLAVLFVYGTLKSTHQGQFGRDKSVRLHRESRLIGPAKMAGRLYDLGRYPCIVDSTAPGEVVYGELVELLDPAASLCWLDAYEGIIAGNVAESEYQRHQRTVHRLDVPPGDAGETITAWVYIYARDPVGARQIHSGLWQA